MTDFKLPNVNLAAIGSSLPVIGPIVAAVGAATYATSSIEKGAAAVKTAVTKNAQSPVGFNPNKAGIDSRLDSQHSAFVKSDTNHKYQLHIVSATKDLTKPVTSISAFLPEEISLDITANYTAPFGEGMFDASGSMVNKLVRTAGISGITQEMSVKIWESTEGINISLPITFIAGEIIGGRQQNNILEPIMDLLSLCAPSKEKNNFFLTPPGPIVAADFGQILKGVQDAVTILSGGNTDGTKDTAEQKNTAQVVDVTQQQSGFDLTTVVSDFKGRVAEATKAIASDVLNFDSRIAVWIGDFLYFDNVVINGVSQNYKMILDEAGRPTQATVQVTFTTMLSPTIQDLRNIFRMNAVRTQ